MLPNDLKDYTEDSFQIVPPELAGGVIAGVIVIILVILDALRIMQ